MRGQRYSGASSRHGGLTRTKDGQIAAMRGAGQPRGAAAGAALNRSRRSAYEPSPDPQRPPEPRNEGSPTPRFGPASRSRDGEGEAHTDSNHSTTMARSLGASMARGLGILLIMMTLSEIAATRARRRPMQHSSPIPIKTSPPLQTARPRGRGAPHKGSARPDTHAHRTNAQAPSSTRTTGPFTSSRRASAHSSRRSGLVLMMSPMPTRRPSVPRPSP